MAKKPPAKLRKETLTPTDAVAAVVAPKAFEHLAEAVGVYLESVGWSAVVVGNPRVQHQPDARKFNYEFVVSFTGGKKA